MVGRTEARRWVWSFSRVTLLVGLLLGCTPVTPATLGPRPTVSGQPVLAATPSPTAPSTQNTPADVVETIPPARTATARPTSAPVPKEEVRPVTFTIVYDNNTYPAAELLDLRTSWGFACWVDAGETTVLFDTGGDGAALMHNLRELDLDPLTVDAVVLSHAHGDHTGGLGALLSTGVKPTVYVPVSFSRSFKEDVRAHADLVEVADPTVVAPGIYTTGEVGPGIKEQALVVETTDGLVVITGCAHPGVDKMVRRAYEHYDDDIALVVGGFHLGSASRHRVEDIIADFEKLDVERVAPCHCTGDAARALFDEAFGEDCVLAGVGWSIDYVSEMTD